jgi:hypothetical protein
MANWGGAASGALGGAAAGATAGSFFPVIGTGIGAAGGALLGGLAGLFTGGPGEYKQSPNKFNPQQQSALNNLLQQGQQGLQNPTAGFEPIEQQAQRRFKSQSLPGLAERFTALGGSDTRGSSDFAGMLGGAQSDFDLGLAALKSQYGMQNQQNALSLLQTGLTPQTDQYYEPGNGGVGPQLLNAGTNAASNYFGAQAFGNQNQGGQISVDRNKLQQLLQMLQKRGG